MTVLFVRIWMRHKSWFHKVGGKYRAGEGGHIDDYALAVTLQNTFNVFKATHPDVPDFMTHATTLADEIFAYAMSFEDHWQNASELYKMILM